MAFDVLILNGEIVDGTGTGRYKGDVGINGDRIAAIGLLAESEARLRVDARGHVVAPGFIDMHSHSDVTLMDDPGGESKVHQGVTTEVTGNCGYSPFPAGEAEPKTLQSLMGTTMASVVEWDWRTMDEWAGRMDAIGISINVAPQLGQGSLRIASGAVQDRPATADQRRAMERLAMEAIEQGAFSVTTGLTLSPSGYATTDEIVELCRAVGGFEGAFYATHARSRPGGHIEMIDEAVEIGRRAGIPVQFSHLAITDSRAYGSGPEMVAVIEEARAQGIDITYDMYPYTAAGIDLNQLIPLWMEEGGTEDLLGRLRDPDLRGRARQETAEGADGRLPPDWDAVVISFVESERNQHVVGESVQAISDATSTEPAEVVLKLIEEEQNVVSAVYHNRVESDIRFFLGQSSGMIGSDGNAISPDGLYGSSKPHPRFYGTYPRVLGRYVRQQPAVLTLEEAIRKMSGFPAQRLGLRDRGYVREGLVADLVIFDPETVIDRSTFDDPHQLAGGMPYVLVSGKPVVWEGKHTGARPGRVLRRGTD